MIQHRHWRISYWTGRHWSGKEKAARYRSEDDARQVIRDHKLQEEARIVKEHE